jgi:O-antigen/teichoic acid export membrane protein
MNQLLKKYRGLSLPLRATIWFTICNFALKGISFVCMPLYTRLLPAGEYGRMTVLTSYEQIFIIFATFEIYLGAFQRGILKFKDDVRTFEQTVVLISNVLTAIIFLLVAAFNKPFTDFTGMTLGFYAVMSIYFLGFAPYNCWLNKKRFDYDYKAAVVVTLVMALLANLVPILTVNIWGRTAYIKVISTLLISALFCLPFWIRDFHPIALIKKGVQAKTYISFALKFQVPLVFHSLSYYILNQSDRIMIDKFSDSSKVAFYSVAYSLATVIILVQNSLNQVLKPWRYKKLEIGAYDEVRKLSNAVVVLIGAGIIAFMLIVPEGFKLLFQKQYYEALICMPPITMGVYFLFLYTIFVDIESYYGKTNYIAYVSTFCAALNIVLNYFGMKVFSYVVCAYTTLICYIIMSALHFVFMKRTCRKVGVSEFPVDSKFIGLFNIGLLVVFICINFVYTSIILRYSILMALLMVAFINRKRILSLITEIREK